MALLGAWGAGAAFSGAAGAGAGVYLLGACAVGSLLPGACVVCAWTDDIKTPAKTTAPTRPDILWKLIDLISPGGTPDSTVQPEAEPEPPPVEVGLIIT